MNTILKVMILMLPVVICTAALSGYLAFSANQAILDSAMQPELTLVERLVQNAIDGQIAKASARAVWRPGSPVSSPTCVIIPAPIQPERPGG
jgi:hypothetical protein